MQPWESIEEFSRQELPSWRESMRAVRWPSREPIEGRWVFSNTFPMTFTFEPSTPLPRGWYAIQVNFGTISVPRATTEDAILRRGGASQFLDDGWTTSRFGIGSFPMIGLFGRIDMPTDGMDGGGRFQVSPSEPITMLESVRWTERLRVTVDGNPVRCTAAASGELGEGELFQSASWNCETPASEGRVLVTFEPPMWESASGLPIRFAVPSNPPTWAGETGVFFSGHNVDDSIFIEEGL